ncbi:cytospin-B isoform X1 [Silurus meridionalis]|nr:cytospin-B isoform X1 [Silurus meridionalis]
MLRGGTTKVALPKTGAPERGRLPSSIGHTSGSTMMKTSRSSSTIASDLRLSRLKRASSDDALAKPALGAAAPASRLKKTVTTGAISELADSRPHYLTDDWVGASPKLQLLWDVPSAVFSVYWSKKGTVVNQRQGRGRPKLIDAWGAKAGIQSTKKSGIPAPRDIPQSISRDRTPLRDQFRTSSTKKMIPSASTSSLSALAKHSRNSVKSKVEAESADRALLECQVKELLAEAKAKDFEISKLRMELQRCRGKGSPQEAGTPDETSEREQTEALPTDTQTLVEEIKEKNSCFLKELSVLQQENQTLKEKLILLENSSVSCGNANTNSTLLASPSKPSVNGLVPEISSNKMAAGGPFKGSPVKTSVSSGSDVTKGSPSPDYSEFEKIPSCADSVCSSTKGVPPSPKEQDISIQCLTQRIQKMEESHHSTAEELQATLQELADQQQVVQELTAENERLSEEKSLLQTSLQQQRERVELLAQKNETLLQRLREQVQSQEAEASRASRAAELEQRLAEHLESSRFEREKLVDIQQQLTGSLRVLEKEHQEAQAAVRGLKDEMESLKEQLEREIEAGAEATRLAAEQRQASEALRVENEGLKAQVETERQKVLELNAVQSASNSTELQALLKTARTDRDKLELSCAELRQELLQAHKDIEHIQGLLSKAEADQHMHQERLESQEQDHKASLLALEEKTRDGETQVKDLKETIFELEDQVEQQRAVQLHTNQIILDLESEIKRLEEHKTEQDKQLKAMSKQMKDETQEWQRFQADLQTAVVVANDIKVEAQQEVRTLRRRLQEEQERSARLAAELEHIQGARSRSEEGNLSDSDSSPQWCAIAMTQNAPGSESESSTPSDPGATVKSLIRSFDTAVKIDELKPSSLMRKSPSLESVVKTPAVLSGRTSSFTYSRANSKLNVERTDPLAALAREYGGSKRNALLKWCQKKTEGYPNVDVTNFSSSWSDGLAFCALLHTYLPAHIPYQELISQDKVAHTHTHTHIRMVLIA